MATKDDITRTMDELQKQIEQAASALPESAWSKGVYENGWDARQLLSHVASTAGMAGFVLAMANASPGGGGGGGGASFNIDDFNAQQVASRQDKSSADLLAEISATFEKEKGVVHATADDLLSKHYKAPWGAEGSVGDVIVESLNGHLGTHLADLRAAGG